MDPADQIKKYFAKRTTAITKFLAKLPGSLTENDFHDLRVEIKKLKSLVSLLNFSASHFRKKSSFQPYAVLFRAAGRVRQLQLEISILKEYRLYNTAGRYRRRLEQKLRMEAGKFSDANGPWTKQQVQEASHSISSFLEKVDKDEIRQYLELKRNEIYRLLTAHLPAANDIHLLRKKIKDYLYISAIFRDDNEFLERMDHYQELIGEWHDTLIIQLSLRGALACGEHDQMEWNRVQGMMITLEEKERRLYQLLNAEKEELAWLLRRLFIYQNDAGEVPDFFKKDHFILNRNI